MSIRTIYCDESGFTGYNLLDPQQPIFAVASADVAEEQADYILKDSFPRFQGDEFKFSNIWRSGNRAGLVRFASHLSAFKDLSFVYMVDKRFAVLTKIVDFLIEPYITDAGYDFYDDGFCWKYTNYIHFGLTQFAPPELLEALLRHYQEFSRDPTPDNLALLQHRLAIMASSTEEPVRIFFEQMELGARLFLKYHDIGTFRGSSELQTSTMIALVSHWRQRHPEDFAIVHDASSNFLRGRDLWERITNNNVPRQMHRLGDGSYVEFPLRVISTTSVDSEDSRSVQFCDLLAGLSTRYFNPGTQDERRLMDEVVQAGLEHTPYNGIRPEPVFPDHIPPKRLSGPDVVDQMAEIIRGSQDDST